MSTTAGGTTTINGKVCILRPRSTSGVGQTPTGTLTTPTGAPNGPLQEKIETAASPAETGSSSSTTSTTDGVLSSSSSSPPDTTSSPALSTSVQPSFLTSILSTQTSTSSVAAEATTGTSSTNSAVSAVANPNTNAVQSTVAVAGGVIGGVVAISIVAFFVWWWRRRVVKRRRSTLLTPLDTSPSYDRRNEKGSYVFSRSSIGPTTAGEKLKAALGYNARRIRGNMNHLVSKSNVNLNRGNSQFMDPVSTHSRANSSALGDGTQVTTKDRFVDWWTRLTADMNFNWRLRDKNADRERLPAMGSAREKRQPTAVGAQPDFLTLLSMDDRELDREAQRRAAGIARKNGSAGSTDHFLNGLNLNFSNSAGGDNPFSDANALAHASAQPAPLVVNQANNNNNSNNVNPFSDANAIRDPPPALGKPGTYVSDMRRSRGQSVSSNTAAAPRRETSALYSTRDSSISEEGSSIPGRRNKFRSDPFDLERPVLLMAGARDAPSSSGSSSTAGTAGSSDVRGSSQMGGGGGGAGIVKAGSVRRPPGARTRHDSFTSKYSSGISMGDWSDPGPDVGPAASRVDGPPEPRESPTQNWRERREREMAQAAALGQGPGQGQGVGRQKSVGRAI
ncbi:hypothetical protein B0T17DRAFT_114738 [Bombardia bombarda]|uniref:Uncharacterized protein n=1 Tax=Bombardia bombarda TaxID=252184 RepID=A0AA39WBR0_9PEZI|nr:hypothetical protein B0T17DRAFT_114738 [Bombardia bombarda]